MPDRRKGYIQKATIGNHKVYLHTGEYEDVISARNIVKVSLIGVGMRSHAGIAGQMFTCLAKKKINIRMISTSEIKISVVIDQKNLENAVKALHNEFKLERK